MKDKKKATKRQYYKPFSEQELTEAIELLDSLLEDGYCTFLDLETENLVLQDREDADMGKLCSVAQKEFKLWYEKVSQVLTRKLNYRHYNFHFSKPRNLRENMPWNFDDFIKNFECYLFALEEVLISLRDEKNLTIRQEIAKKEFQAEILYKITYSDHSREIKLNGITIVKPDFESENDRFFNYVYLNPNHSISREEIEKSTQEKLKKSNSDILKDLGFTGPIRQIFFPGTSKTKLKFNNPITKEYAYQHDLPDINLHELKGNKGNYGATKGGKGKKRH